MVCLFQVLGRFSGEASICGLIIALCGGGPSPSSNWTLFFQPSNGDKKCCLHLDIPANRNGQNAPYARKSLRTSCRRSSLTNLKLVSNDDRYERYLHNGFVFFLFLFSELCGRLMSLGVQACGQQAPIPAQEYQQSSDGLFFPHDALPFAPDCTLKLQIEQPAI